MKLFTKLKCAIKALLMTKWFIAKSYEYINQRGFRSKITFASGLLPAWIRFIALTYADYKVSYNI